ncbi:MAG: aminopeptidase P family protein, partial [Mariprofundus sp.]|nr:aminopeptidase P family protein [Mariprofundus sp.]
MIKNRLIIADSEHNADMLYATGMFVPDAFIALEIDGRWHGLFSPLEVGRAKKESHLHEAHLDTPWRQAAESAQYTGLAGIAAAFLKHRNIDQVDVPADFPLRYAEQLRSWGIEVSAVEGAFFPGRSVKSDYELRCLARSESLTRKSMQQGEAYLAACGIGDDGVLRDPETAKKVESADVRRVIEVFLIANGAMPAHTIVA